MICHNSGTRTRVHTKELETESHLKHNVYQHHGPVAATQELEQEFIPETENHSKHNVYQQHGSIS